MPSNYRPRLSVELTEVQYKKLNTYIPWGMQKHVFSAIIDDLIDVMEKAGSNKIIAAIISKMMKPSELIKSLDQEESNGGS